MSSTNKVPVSEVDDESTDSNAKSQESFLIIVAILCVETLGAFDSLMHEIRQLRSIMLKSNNLAPASGQQHNNDGNPSQYISSLNVLLPSPPIIDHSERFQELRDTLQACIAYIQELERLPLTGNCSTTPTLRGSDDGVLPRDPSDSRASA